MANLCDTPPTLDPVLTSGAEAVHLHQQLVERVLPLVVAAAEAALVAGTCNCKLGGGM